MTSVAFDSSSKIFLTASADGGVRIWDLEHAPETVSKAGPPTDPRPFEQLNAYIQAMTAHHIDRSGVFAPLEDKKLEAAWKIATRASK